MSGSLIITRNMLDNLNYDKIDEDTKGIMSTNSTDNSYRPTLLIVFAKSDINAALYYLTESMNKPLKCDAIATVLVEEFIKDDFMRKLKCLLKPLDSTSEKFMQTANNTTLNKIERIETDGIIRLICNLNHEHLKEHSGIVTMHSFRTAKECIHLIRKEHLLFSSLSIWHENHAYAYEIIIALHCQKNYINCYNIDLPEIQSQCKTLETFAIVHKNYHYEKLLLEDKEMIIIFPFGTIFAN